MKKVLLGVLTVGMMVVTTPANAEVKNYRGTGETRAAACSDAKSFAQNLLDRKSVV